MNMINIVKAELIDSKVICFNNGQWSIEDIK